MLWLALCCSSCLIRSSHGLLPPLLPLCREVGGGVGVGSPQFSRGAAAAQTMLLLQVPAGLRSVATMFVLRRSAASYDKIRSDFHLDADITSCPQVGGGNSRARYLWVRCHTEPVHPQLVQYYHLSPSRVDIFVTLFLWLSLVLR